MKKWYKVTDIHEDDAFHGKSYSNIAQVGDVVEITEHVISESVPFGYTAGIIRKKYQRTSWFFWAIKLEKL